MKKVVLGLLCFVCLSIPVDAQACILGGRIRGVARAAGRIATAPFRLCHHGRGRAHRHMEEVNSCSACQSPVQK